MLHSDNGGEFKGEVKKLLSEYSIKHVKGRAYNPKCQGLSENSNRYVKKYLQLGYLTNNTEIFDIGSSLQEITIGYNKRPHSVTKIEPEKAFFKLSKKLLLEIRQNTEKYYHSIVQHSIKLMIGDKIGIYSKVSVSKKGFIKIKNQALKDTKQKIIRILGIIEEVHEFGKVKVKVEFTIEENLLAGESVYCDSGILRIMNTESYEGILKNLRESSTCN